MPRNEIFEGSHPLANNNDKSDRLIIRLGKKYIIDNNKYFTCPITVYRYTNLKSIRNTKDNKIEVLKVSGGWALND